MYAPKRFRAHHPPPPYPILPTSLPGVSALRDDSPVPNAYIRTTSCLIWPSAVVPAGNATVFFSQQLEESETHNPPVHSEQIQ